MSSYEIDCSVLWREPYGSMLANGIFTTIHLSLLAWTIALLVGVLIGVLRVVPSRPARTVGFFYVQIFRNIPLLLHLFIWYFAVPLLFTENVQEWLNRDLDNLPYWASVIGLGLYTASRVAEQIRAGLLALPKGYREAAIATGLSTVQAYRNVFLPYALRIMIPPLTAEFLTCFKNSALAMTIGVMETAGAAYHIDSLTYHGLETITAASLVYIMLTTCIVLLMRWIENQIRIPGLIERER
ncbi:amino acid ABC transporter permease [uncultured Desulfosarcina sp.]|uniref:amino acid ABC transporter permease n=1 Tax=uncultured Desulfosarcina sp. TaxID=218289 RepID=UPI0029C9359F|nr:amino acid ABC transporter permease [uncultured Desulfosarcina sp.]